MKKYSGYIVLTLIFIAAFLALDRSYYRELNDHYEYTKWVLENFCVRSGRLIK